MTRQQPESVIVNAILRALNDLPNTFVKKTHGNRYSVAWPDLIGTHHGQAVALEVKTATGKVTMRQQHELAKWRQGGALTGVVRSVDEALAVIGHVHADVLVCVEHGKITGPVLPTDAQACIDRHREAGCGQRIVRRKARAT